MEVANNVQETIGGYELRVGGLLDSFRITKTDQPRRFPAEKVPIVSGTFWLRIIQARCSEGSGSRSSGALSARATKRVH